MGLILYLGISFTVVGIYGVVSGEFLAGAVFLVSGFAISLLPGRFGKKESARD